MRKIPARYTHIVTPFIISILMSCVVSGIATLHSAGLHEGFVALWMSGWAWSWAVAFPTLLCVLPIVRKIVSKIVEKPGNG
ncbi:MAG: DUF2798 domain-containing protein [Alphaproteobacteria bacterium]|nr:DUF2798 domain-containing protein [Alphaproteobacteria bacterium]